LQALQISSLSNPRVKAWMQLYKGNQRGRQDRFLVEGYLECQRGIHSGFELLELMYCPDIIPENQINELLKLTGPEAPKYILDKKVYARLAYRDDTQGVMALFKKPDVSLADFRVEPGKTPLFLILEDVEKPGNLGAVLRTADAVNASGVILTGKSGTDQFNPNVIRASIGTVFSVPVVYEEEIKVLEWLKDQKIMSLSAALPAFSDLYSLQLNQPSALIFGNEHQGLSEFWIKNADVVFTLPMLGKADSLNVSVSVAVAAFEYLRQYRIVSK
jgi:TrmH family RNA methyltransferase